MCFSKRNKYLDPAITEVWQTLKQTCLFYADKDKNLHFNDNEDLFRAQFEKIYNRINNEYMKRGVKELDRHKVVAAMIVACIECGIISHTQNNTSRVILAPHMISLEVGLNWMLIGLNDELEKANLTARISEYEMPKAFACPTPYFEIFARNLYYAEKKGPGLNVLDIAEKLFLIEYITLLTNGISPETLQFKR